MSCTEIKSRDIPPVWEPFNRMAREIQHKHTRKLFFKWLKEVHKPRCERFEATDPELYKAMRGHARNYWALNNEYVNEGLAGELPPLQNVSTEMLLPYATEEVREQITKGSLLQEKAKVLKTELEGFLQGFTSWEQAIFSLPELKNFAPVKAVSQKRPRFVKVPSAQLRRLIQEAVRLKEAGV